MTQPTSSVERIPNRRSEADAWPAWLCSPAWLMPPLFAVLAVVYFSSPDARMWYVGGLWLAGARRWAYAAWARSVAWVEVGPDRLQVRFFGRQQIVSMDDVLDIEAHRHWQSSLAKDRNQAYWLKIRRARGRQLLVEYLQPAAGDRVLAALHRFGKPILVYA